MKMRMRKGFTLVELLIVIVIIGILAAAMMLSSGSATDSAEASNIITDMRGLKTACTMLYADSMDAFNVAASALKAPELAALAKYMDNPSKLDAAFSIELNTAGVTPADGKWYIKFDFGQTSANRNTKGVKDKIAGRSKSIGLYSERKYNGASYAGGDIIYMVAR